MYFYDFSGEVLLLRMWWVHMHVLSFFLSFCIAWHPQCFFLVSSLFVLAEQSISSLRFSLLSRCHCPTKACGLFHHLRFEFQTSKQSVHGFFIYKKKGAQKPWLTLPEGDITSKYSLIQPPPPRHAYCSIQNPHVNHVKSRKSHKTRKTHKSRKSRKGV